LIGEVLHTNIIIGGMEMENAYDDLGTSSVTVTLMLKTTTFGGRWEGMRRRSGSGSWPFLFRGGLLRREL
jgi:hypothetical protein